MSAIVLNNLCRYYGEVRAVDGVSYEIGEGELFALLGQNGAGKTTTIKMLTGLVKPTGGSATVLGFDIANEMNEIKPLISVSPQETAVAPKLTVKENLAFIAGIYGISDAHKKADDLIETFHLTEKRDTYACKLSGGQMRRLSIAMALITEPKVLFLDEPTLGVDVMARKGLQSIIKSLHGRVTIILTTHYLEEASCLADRIGVMSKGKLVTIGTPEELMQSTGTDSLDDAFIALVGKESDWE